ncbi:MAG TPA: polyribonucleotide nucleotidyltransferase [Chloroflexota bacterium]|nr:polyribonucleotide nucleotidyltransferase [Chloroflexota bacterium]
MPNIYQESTEIGGRQLTFETGRLAEQAGGAVTATLGETVVLATATASSSPRQGVDFFPLTCDYEEKLYAAGKIPGGFIKREGRPSTEAILVSRLTDRPLRPLFPKGFRNDVQVVVTPLSVDQENTPDVVAITAASAALMVSDIPFNGPIGAVRVGLIGDEFVVNPTFQQLRESRLDLVMAATRDAVVMVEADALGVSEADVLEALDTGHRAIVPLIHLQERLREAAGKPKREFPLAIPDEEFAARVSEYAGERLRSALVSQNKQQREEQLGALRKDVVEHFTSEEVDEQKVSSSFDALLKKTTRSMILDEGIRPDGRSLREIRPISVAAGILPRTHGSGLFQRGQTQVLTVCTLGSTSDEQMIDGLGEEESKRYMHHYNFPPFSTGETRPMRGPSRRDIGHGMLAERALAGMIPSSEKFPYTIRLVSEVLSSNGSTSMASVCGSTLALLDAGVPLTAPVAGIAMGLITDDTGRFAVLTDIQGMEDALGDMDFKVAGTRSGITAIQMDIKVSGLSRPIMEQALEQANVARQYILNRILEVMPGPRSEMSQYAPRITRIQINPDKIGAVIGPGGKQIKKIIEETKVSIDIEDDGSVLIASSDAAATQRAIEIVRSLTEEVEVGKTYHGTVRRLMDFGAFVEVLPGKEGLVHISQLATHRVEKVSDVVNLGDPLDVKVTGIDSLGRINLSHRAVIDPDWVDSGNGGGEQSRRSGGYGGGDRARSGSGGYGSGERRGGSDGPRRFDRPPGGERRDRGPRTGGGYNSNRPRRDHQDNTPRES